jgi:hypothetical protein
MACSSLPVAPWLKISLLQQNLLDSFGFVPTRQGLRENDVLPIESRRDG